MEVVETDYHGCDDDDHNWKVGGAGAGVVSWMVQKFNAITDHLIKFRNYSMYVILLI